MAKKILVSAALLALAVPGMAAAGSAERALGAVDVYYVPSDKLGGDSSSGTGIGIKGSFDTTSLVGIESALVGDYQYTDSSSSGSVLKQLRIGPAVAFPIMRNLAVGADLQFARVEVAGGGATESKTGFAGHGGVAYAPIENVHVGAALGYASVKDLYKGLEFILSAGYAFSPSVGVWTDFRDTKLDSQGGSGSSDTSKTFRVGLHVAFGD